MALPPALTRPIFGIPTWIVGIVVIGAGVGLYFVIKGRQASSSNTLGQSSSPAPDTSQIDPYTGVPYSIEGSTNPATGLPAYYGGPGIDPTPPPTSTPTPSPQTYVTTKSGASLETSPRDANGGRTLQSLPQGALLTFVSGPVPDPQKTSKVYYQVNYNGQTGYVGSDAVKLQSGGTGSGPNTPFQATPYWPIMTDVIAAGALS